MDEYKSRLSTYLSNMIKEELVKYEGGYTDEWNDQRKKNAEVLGYKLTGKADIKEGATEFWQDMFKPGNIPNQYISQLIKKKGELPSKKHIKQIYRDNGNPSSSQLKKAFKQLAKEKYIKKQGSMWKWESGFAWRTGKELESTNEAKIAHSKGGYVEVGKWYLLNYGKWKDTVKVVSIDAKGMKVYNPNDNWRYTIPMTMIKKKKIGGYMTPLKESLVESVNEGGMGILSSDQADVLQGIVMRNKNKNTKAILNVALKSGFFKGVDKKELLGYIDGARQFVKYMKSHPMESINEKMGPEQYHKYMQYVFDTQFKTPEEKKMKKSIIKKINKGQKKKGLPLFKEERDYKAEYKKFQSSTKSKKYRAELNQYNRKKGTYGNGDGKDASHKGGKIAGFEKESTNRGRREKSRLKKEFVSVNETVEPQGNMAKIAKIVKRKQATKLSGVMIDMQSASLLMKLWDAVSDKDKEKMNKLNAKVLTNVIKKLWSRVNLRLPI